jgi:hypothetical protein
VLESTADTGFTGRRKWTETAAEVMQNQNDMFVNAKLPEGTTAWFVRLHSGNLIGCSDLQETRKE